MKRISLLITEAQLKALKELDLTISDNIRRAIDEYLAKLKKGKK